VAKKNKPDKVTHKTTSSLPLMPPGIGPQIHEVTIEKKGRKVTGTGWSRQAAEQEAGNRYRRGESD